MDGVQNFLTFFSSLWYIKPILGSHCEVASVAPRSIDLRCMYRAYSGQLSAGSPLVRE